MVIGISAARFYQALWLQQRQSVNILESAHQVGGFKIETAVIVDWRFRIADLGVNPRVMGG